MKSAVEIRDVSVMLKGKEILKNINFTLEEGKFLGIVGPNGGGKTTLVKIILGLISPTSGSAAVFGSSPEALLHGNGVFGYLPQHQNIDPNFPASALDIVLMGRYGRRVFSDGRAKRTGKKASKCMSMMGIESLRDVQYSQLSGGQQQRVSIARALAGEPKILILDEPSTGIDVVGQEDFYHLLKGLQKKMNLTIIWYPTTSGP
jgi:zinc transport system ATP-binding protein